MLIGALLDRLGPPRPGRPRLVGVDGFSGSGKTTLAEALGARDGVSVVSIEQFYRGWSGLAEGVREAREQLVDALLAGRTPVVTPWDWRRDRIGEPRPLALGPVVVLEGCGAGAGPLREHQDLTIWVHADAAERERRLRARADWPQYAPHRPEFDRQERSLAAREDTRAQSDVVVAVDPNGGIALIAGEGGGPGAVPSGP